MLKLERERAEGEVMSGNSIIVCYCVGGAGLALWLLARFPSVGPQRPLTVILAVLAVWIGLEVAGVLVGALAQVGRFGIVLALLAVVLPTLTTAFWVSGCVLRSLAGLPGLRR